ncbi:MAG: radical SAM protein [Planctomycetota bacterium]|nr:MAG: radical SAM protein [Planctomycetota bacterium]
MLLLVNPKATRSKNRRFPLSLLSLAAVLPEKQSWQILDGNRPGTDLVALCGQWIHKQAKGPDPVTLIAVTCMPGPQLPSAVAFSRAIKSHYPNIPVVWGGYFPTLYPDPVLRASYVDWVIQGQGEQTLLDLLEVLEGEQDPHQVPGLSFDNHLGKHRGQERVWEAPDAFPPLPFHHLPVEEYLIPTHLGKRSGVYQASLGCPFQCGFCGVIGAFGSREKFSAPERVESDLRLLKENYGMDSLHFYDNNFFLQEAHAAEMAARLEPLELSWWCEARADVLLRFSDATWQALAASGLKMMFIGAESGNDERLLKMKKGITVAQVEEVARRSRQFDIVPEFSFCLGDPEQPEKETRDSLNLIRRLKQWNPAAEIVFYYYTPTPQKRTSYYSNLIEENPTPDTLEEWSEPQWTAWACHTDPKLPWLSPELRRTIESFRTVIHYAFPSVHDSKAGKLAEQIRNHPAWFPWWKGDCTDLHLLDSLADSMSKPDKQAYGHLRDSRTP